MKHFLFLILGVGIFFGSCSKDDEDSTDDKKTETPIFVAGAGVTDLEGNSYKTVIINYSTSTLKSAAQQEWMAENLRATKYANGSEIDPMGISVCNNDVGTLDSLGYLYGWDALMNNSTTPGSQGACPNGWHVPTNEEFSALINGLGGSSIAGMKMKSKNSSFWNDVSLADNSSGFNAHGGGWNMMGTGFSVHFKNATMFWTSTEDLNSAKIIQLNSKSQLVVNQIVSSKTTMSSCRCVKD